MSNVKKVIVSGVGTVSALLGSYAIYQKMFNTYKKPKSIPVVSCDTNPNLKLELVQVVFRHGARTSLHSPEYLPKIHYNEELMKHGDHTYVPIKAVSEDGDSEPQLTTFVEEQHNHGQLTKKGADQMHNLGICLRDHYVTKLNFLPSKHCNLVYVRSTAVKRAIESARCTLAGLFPTQEVAIPIECYNEKNEILYPNFEKCEYLASLLRWSWFFPDLIAGMKKEREHLQTMLGIPLDQNVHLVILRDYLFAHDHHGLLPDQYNRADIMQRAEAAALKIMDYAFSGFHHTREKALQLGIGLLLNLFLTNMDSAIDRTSNVKMRLFSGHDTTLMPLLRAFGVEGVWTPYAGSIILELYEDTSNKAEVDHYVRVLYEFEELVIPGCDGALCQIDQFRKAISKYVIDEKQFKEDCAIKDDHLLQSLPKPLAEAKFC